MISTNDTTILAMLSRYPFMSQEKADSHIERIEHPENIPICHAVMGRISRAELQDDAKLIFDEFQRWSASRTQRIRNEQITARQNNEETNTAKKMLELHRKGVINDQTLLMYGISGPLPERQAYNGESRQNRTRIWTDRLERRFGRDWRNRFRSLPEMFRSNSYVDWKREGF